MQLIAEAYDLLKNAVGLTNEEIGSTFTEWNSGDLDSFLIEITAQIFQTKDPDTGDFLVDKVLDKAAQKGNRQVGFPGRPRPRRSGHRDHRGCLRALSVVNERPACRGIDAACRPTGTYLGDKKAFVDAIRDALYASKVVAYARASIR